MFPVFLARCCWCSTAVHDDDDVKPTQNQIEPILLRMCERNDGIGMHGDPTAGASSLLMRRRDDEQASTTKPQTLVLLWFCCFDICLIPLSLFFMFFSSTKHVIQGLLTLLQGQVLPRLAAKWTKVAVFFTFAFLAMKSR